MSDPQRYPGLWPRQTTHSSTSTARQTSYGQEATPDQHGSQQNPQQVSAGTWYSERPPAPQYSLSTGRQGDWGAAVKGDRRDFRSELLRASPLSPPSARGGPTHSRTTSHYPSHDSSQATMLHPTYGQSTTQGGFSQQQSEGSHQSTYHTERRPGTQYIKQEQVEEDPEWTDYGYQKQCERDDRRW